MTPLLGGHDVVCPLPGPRGSVPADPRDLGASPARILPESGGKSGGVEVIFLQVCYIYWDCRGKDSPSLAPILS